jgi:hypothetical protein
MKKTLVLLPLIVSLTACGTFSSKSEYEKINDRAREARVDNQEKVVKKEPKWHKEPPKFDGGAYYATGTYAGFDRHQAEDVATTLALGKMCQTVAGEVSRLSKVTQTNLQTLSDTAIQSRCRNVPVTGYVLHNRDGFVDNNGAYRSYVLIALPVGDANALAQQVLMQTDVMSSKKRAEELQNELTNSLKR